MPDKKLEAVFGSPKYVKVQQLIDYAKEHGYKGRLDDKSRTELRTIVLTLYGTEDDREAKRSRPRDQKDDEPETTADEDEDEEQSNPDKDTTMLTPGEDETTQTADGRTLYRFKRAGWYTIPEEFSTKSGKMVFADPGTSINDRDSVTVPKTSWKTRVYVRKGRVWRLQVTNSLFSQGPNSSHSGPTVLVDGGQAGCYDGGTYDKTSSIPKAKSKNHKGDRDWAEYASTCAPEVSPNCADLVVFGSGVTASSGDGDGGYPVSIFTNKQDQVTRAEIDFTQSGCVLL